MTLAQGLYRHGARDPTAKRTIEYEATIRKIQAGLLNVTGDYAFLTNFSYSLGADLLTDFGRQELVDSGTQFFNRYSALSKGSRPFLRASGDPRVIESAEKFADGFHQARVTATGGDSGPDPYDILILSEDSGSNNR